MGAMHAEIANRRPSARERSCSARLGRQPEDQRPSRGEKEPKPGGLNHVVFARNVLAQTGRAWLGERVVDGLESPEYWKTRRAALDGDQLHHGKGRAAFQAQTP